MAVSTHSRPTYIWDLPALLDLLEHPSKNVQKWAADHVLKLYPEAAHQAIEILPQASEAVVDSLLYNLKDVTLPDSGVETLRQFLLSGATDSQKADIVNTLLRHGIIPDEGDLDDLPIERLLHDLPDTNAAAEFIFSKYLDGLDEGEPDVHALAKVCDVEDLYHIIEDLYEDDLPKSVRTFEKLWGIDIPSIHKVRTLAETQQVLREALAATSESYMFEDTRFPLLINEIRKIRERIATVLEMTEAGKHSESTETDLLLACALGVFRDTACLRGLSKKPDAKKLWRYLTMRPWKGEDIDPELIVALEGEKHNDTLTRFRKAIGSDSAYAAYAYRVLESLKTPGRHQLLLDALEGDFGESVIEDLDGIETLLFEDLEASEALLEEWREKPPKPQLFALLRLHPTDETVRLLLEHFEHYMSQPFSSFLIDTMAEIGSQSFVEPLLREWRAGEDRMSGVIRFLAELHGLEDDEAIKRIPDVDGEALEETQTEVEESDDFLDVLGSLRPPLPLQCTSCNHTYHYRLDTIQIGKRIEDFAANQVVQCKGCGSLETYRFTVEASAILTIELMRVKMLADLQDTEEPPDTYLVPPGRIKFTSGKSFRNLSEAYHYLIKQLERDPENPALHKRLGNLMRNGLRPDLAIPYFKEAIRLDPKEIDSIHVTADILVEQGLYWEAVPHLERLVNLCRDPEMDEDLCRKVFESLLTLTTEIQDEIGHRIELFKIPDPSSLSNRKGIKQTDLEFLTLDPDDPDDFEDMFHLYRNGKLPERRLRPRRIEPDSDPSASERQEPVRVTKVGRNQPCSCGSGKKYKRCCGR